MKKYVNKVANKSKHLASTWFQLNAAHKNSFVIFNTNYELKQKQDREDKYNMRVAQTQHIRQAPFVGTFDLTSYLDEDFFVVFNEFCMKIAFII